MLLGEHEVDAFLKRSGSWDGEVFPEHGKQGDVITEFMLERGDDLLGFVPLFLDVAGAADEDADGFHGSR